MSPRRSGTRRPVASQRAEPVGAGRRHADRRWSHDLERSVRSFVDADSRAVRGGRSAGLRARGHGRGSTAGRLDGPLPADQDRQATRWRRRRRRPDRRPVQGRSLVGSARRAPPAGGRGSRALGAFHPTDGSGSRRDPDQRPDLARRCPGGVPERPACPDRGAGLRGHLQRRPQRSVRLSAVGPDEDRRHDGVDDDPRLGLDLRRRPRLRGLRRGEHVPGARRTARPPGPARESGGPGRLQRLHVLERSDR